MATDDVRRAVFAGYEAVQRAFRSLDPSGTGQVSQEDFRDVLLQAGITMTDHEFEKLMRAYDPQDTGSVLYERFNQGVQRLIHPSPSGALVVHMPPDPKTKRSRQTVNTARFASMVEGKFARHAVQSLTELCEVFRQSSPTGNGKLNRKQFVAALRSAGFAVTDEKVDELVKACGVDANGDVQLNNFSQLMYDSLLDATVKLDHSRRARFGPRETAPLPFIDSETARQIFTTKLFCNFNSVKHAYRALDVQGTGQVPYSRIRQVMMQLGMRMTDEEFAKFIIDYDPKGLGYITYMFFNNIAGGIIQPGEDGRGVMENRRVTPRLSPWVEPKFAQDMVHKLGSIDAVFDWLDTDHSAAISPAEYIQAVNQAGFSLKPDEAIDMVRDFKKDSKGNITREFFKEHFQKLMKMPADPYGEPPAEFYTGITFDCEDAQKAFCHKLFTKFRTVQRAFEMFDEEAAGAVTYAQFRQTLAHLGFHLSDYEFSKFVQLYDPPGTGKITYKQFNAAVGSVIQPAAHDHHNKSRLKGAPAEIAALPEWIHDHIRGLSKVPETDAVIASAPTSKQGIIPIASIRVLLREYGINLSHNEATSLAQHYANDGTALGVTQEQLRAMITPPPAAAGAARAMGGLGSSASVPVLPRLNTRTAATPGMSGRSSSRSHVGTAASTWARPGTSMSTSLVQRLEVASAASRVAALLKGRSMKDVFKHFRAADPEGRQSLTEPEFLRQWGRLGVTADDADMEVLLSIFGKYSPGVKHRDIDYMAFIRKVFVEKMAPTTVRLSPISSSRSKSGGLPGFSSTQPPGSAGDNDPADGATSTRSRPFVQTPPSWPHTLDVRNSGGHRNSVESKLIAMVRSMATV